MHGVFDIVGPVMIGPSSSHTAGAARLGLMARKILGGAPVRARIGLTGSFARTGKGHGTDKAIAGGLLGFRPDDERIRDALQLAPDMGLAVAFYAADRPDAHPNTALLDLERADGRTVHIEGASVGGGNILVNRIGDYAVELTGVYPALLTVHRDRPGVITAVTQILAEHALNVAFMRVSRQSRGERAMMILELDERPDQAIVAACQRAQGVDLALSIPAVE